MPGQDQADKLCGQAKAAFRQRDFVGARKLYEDAIAADKRHIPATEGLAFVCFLTKDYTQAAELFLRVSRLDPRRAEPLINLGATYNRMEDYATAIRYLRQALAKDRRNADAYYNIGLAYRHQKQFGLSVSAYKEAIRLKPDMLDAHFNLGNTLLEMGSHSQAVRAFEAALQIDPESKKIRGGLQRAQESNTAAKAQISPFGRLVNMAEVEARNKLPDKTFKKLDANARFLDRDKLHRLAREAEQLGTGFLGQIHDELEAALLAVSRIVSENRDTHEWHREADQLEQAFDRFQQVQAALGAKIEEIRSYEESMVE
ncbi:MAG: tetratricopeptide repeat protein [Planctomycetaceae bacterium]|nr:tetratricopeptide repeat protein [Planctomycetaceae bacterium]